MELSLVILAAGLSSRYGGLKQLEPVGPAGEALMDYGLYDAVRAGFTRGVFVVRSEIEAEVREHVDNLLSGTIPTAFVQQRLDDPATDGSGVANRTKPWGTAHAVLAARREIRAPFAVCNADDFYGAAAYDRVARHLSDHDAMRKHPIALVGYRLEQTLSAAGGVSRAVCETDESGTLTRIVELKEVARSARGIGGRSVTGVSRALTGLETVSMNLWGFTPDVFPAFARQFERFVGDSARDPDIEFLIPTAVAEQVARGETSVLVLDTNCEWMGVTFRDDRERVARRIRQLVTGGVYPRNLSDWFRTRK